MKYLFLAELGLGLFLILLGFLVSQHPWFCLALSVGIVFGLFYLTINWMDANEENRRKTVCTVLVTATISEVKETTTVSRDGIAGTTLYRPTYSYVYEGRPYSVLSRSDRISTPMKTGETRTLYIDPSAPETYLLPGEMQEAQNWYRWQGIVSVAAGILLYLLVL